MTSDQQPCAECGQHPSDRRATKDRRWHGGNRFAFRVWVVLLFASLVLAMPWVQTKLGWRIAEMDHTELRDPRPRILPMVDPPVRWRDVQAAAQGDTEAIELIRTGISDSIPLSHTSLDAEHTTLRVDMIQNKFREPGSRVRMRQYYDHDAGERFRQLLYVRISSDFTGYGWPYSWHRQFGARLIDYEENVYESNPMGVAPEPTSTVEHDYFERWSWAGIVASIAFVWWSGWLAAVILRKVGVKKSLCTAVRWCVVIGLLATSLLIGLNPTHKETPTLYSSAHEKIPADADSRERSIDELRELISDDEGVRQIVHRLIERHNALDRPNALVGLISLSPVRSSMYSLRFGYWGESGLDYSRMSYFTVDEDGTATPIARERSSQRNSRFNLSLRAMTISVLSGNPPNTRHLIRIDFALLLTWLAGLAILLHALRWCVRPFYRRVQKKRAKRNLCIWCKYPVPGNP